MPTHPRGLKYRIGVGFHLGGCKCFSPSTSGLNNKTIHYFWSFVGRRRTTLRFKPSFGHGWPYFRRERQICVG